MVITFFGHSDFRGSMEDQKKILMLLEDCAGINTVDLYLGGYGAFDAFAYACCKEYKQMHPDASLFFITPYMTLEYQQRYLKELAPHYDGIIYPEIEDKPLKFAIPYRNRWMIDRADYVIFGLSRAQGGAYKAYQYAQRCKKPFANITGEIF